MLSKIWLRNKLTMLWMKWHGIELNGRMPWFNGRFPSVMRMPHARIIMGSDCVFGHDRASIAALDHAVLRFGNGVSINNCGGRITATTSVTIGDHCRLAEGVRIMDDTFHPLTPGQPRAAKPVVLGRNVWLCNNVFVLHGVSIGDHTAVGAGSVVTHDLPDRCLAVGAPAKVVRRFECADDWIRP